MPTPNKVAQRTGQITLFTPNRRLFLSWQLIIDWAKARGKAGARESESRKKWVLVGSGDVIGVDYGRRMEIARLASRVELGTISLNEFRFSMVSKTPNPRAAKQIGGAIDTEELISSIVPAQILDCNLWLREICKKLLPHTTGWENLFLREVIKLPKISQAQEKKIQAIAARYEKEKSSRRLCRYCQSKVQEIDEYSYYCNKCGNCLNLNWNGGAE